MDPIPIQKQVFNISRSALDGAASTLAAIDRGCSLTKVVYVSKSGKGDTDTHYALHCVVFANSDFEGCLHFLKENALLPSSGKIRATGTGCEMYKHTVERILGLKVEIIDEFLSGFRGLFFFLNNLQDRESAFFPPIPFNPSLKVNQTPDKETKMKEEMGSFSRNNGLDPSAQFPCVFVVIGSGVIAKVIFADGRTKVTGMTMIGGKTLLALGRALVGTDSYDELLELAQRGCSGSIDTTVDEFLKKDPDSQYGDFPQKLPLFPFGKLIDNHEKISDYKVEDRAASVVRLVALSITNLIGAAMAREGVSRVVVGGNSVRGEAFRAAIYQHMQSYSNVPLDIKFLKLGAISAIGAMISVPEDTDKYLMNFCLV